MATWLCVETLLKNKNAAVVIDTNRIQDLSKLLRECEQKKSLNK